MYQDVNVMMLIGFGYLMVFIKTHAWSALTYTFLINALVVQQYILWQQFWHKAFTNTWGTQIYITETSFTGASYCVASMLIAFGAVIGKVDPNTLLPLANFGTIFYTLNEVLCYEILGVKDSGGSTVIHTFGAYFGLTMALLVSSKIKPNYQQKFSYLRHDRNIVPVDVLAFLQRSCIPRKSIRKIPSSEQHSALPHWKLPCSHHHERNREKIN